jgi:PIN domain nuclease of toxin-antitoxin system
VDISSVDVLLDTHTAVWWAEGASDLDQAARKIIADAANTVWFSAASAWELSIKIRSGKLSVDVSKLVDQLTRNGIRILGIGIDDGIAAGALDWDHRDPFDRMLVAQSQRLGCKLATRDAAIQAFLKDQALPV